MAYQIFQLPKTVPVASATVVPGAKLYFYLTGTTTPTPVYTDSALATPFTQPIVADAAGAFATIYLDPLITYKATLTTSADVLLYTIDPVNDSLFTQDLVGEILYPRTAAEIAAGITPTNYYCPPLNINRYGTNSSPGTTDMATALQNAVNVAIELGGGTVSVPSGTYRINSSVTVSGAVSGINIVGDGQGATFIDCGITGAAAAPLLLINTSSAYYLIQGITFRGNSLTTSSGNGNCISCINPGVILAPQQTVFRDVAIYGFAGTGQNQSGSSIPSCGIFANQSTGFVFDHVFIYGCKMGVRLRLIENAEWIGGGIDACVNNCAYLDQCHAVAFHGGQFQSSGAGGATDGGVYLETCSAIVFDGGEAKSCNPYLFNLNGTNIYNHNIRICGMYLDQLDVAGGTTAIRANNGARNLTVEDNFFLFVNTMTTAKGVEVVQNFSGASLSGLRIIGNSFQIGSGGTITACVHLNVTSNRVRSPVIQSNTFGFWTGAGSATTITNGILLDGRVEDGLIDSNTFATSANLTITNAINVNSANVLSLRIHGNEYDTVAGTITNQFTNGGGAVVERIERQVTTELTPAQITANTDDYAPTSYDQFIQTLRLSTDASRNLTGVTGGSAGRKLKIFNVGAQDLVLVNDATSSVINRFLLGANVTLNANEGIDLWYDSTSSRWRASGRHT